VGEDDDDDMTFRGFRVYQQNRENVLLRKVLVRHLAGLPVKVFNLEKLRRANLIK
jgi:hypothetical protein|tara:strand:- start:221 stop:385 length:165 start_codon:yes stop_codon:yes gene_type:complete